jgi:hypothetical protein
MGERDTIQRFERKKRSVVCESREPLSVLVLVDDERRAKPNHVGREKNTRRGEPLRAATPTENGSTMRNSSPTGSLIGDVKKADAPKGPHSGPAQDGI